MRDYSHFISNLGYSITEFLTTYFQTQWNFFITQITDSTSPGRISLSLGIIVLLLVHLGGQIYKYINRD